MENLTDTFFDHFFDFSKNFIAGSFAGVAECITTYPLDTVKVRLQSDTERKYKGALDCFMKAVKDDGFVSLYNGMHARVVANAIMLFFLVQCCTYKYN